MAHLLGMLVHSLVVSSVATCLITNCPTGGKRNTVTSDATHIQKVHSVGVYLRYQTGHAHTINNYIYGDKQVVKYPTSQY